MQNFVPKKLNQYMWQHRHTLSLIINISNHITHEMHIMMEKCLLVENFFFESLQNPRQKKIAFTEKLRNQLGKKEFMNSIN